MAQILADPHQGLIERQPGFDADHREVQRIRQRQLDAPLAALIMRFSTKPRQKESEGAHADHQHRRVEAADSRSPARIRTARHARRLPTYIVRCRGSR